MARGDALHLSTLTGLTYLDLHHADKAVDELASVALACNLSQLRLLDISKGEVGAALACIPALAKLTSLTYLAVPEEEALQPKHLSMLTGLTNLKRVVATVEDQEAWQRFAAAMPQCGGPDPQSWQSLWEED